MKKREIFSNIASATKSQLLCLKIQRKQSKEYREKISKKATRRFEEKKKEEKRILLSQGSDQIREKMVERKLDQSRSSTPGFAQV